MFDKHCVSCHDYGQEAGQKLNLAGDLGLPFNTSYVELRKKKYVNVPGAGPFQTLSAEELGFACQSLGRGPAQRPRRPGDRRAGATGSGGIRPHCDMDRHQRSVLSRVRQCVSRQSLRSLPLDDAHSRRAATSDRFGRRELHAVRVERLSGKFPGPRRIPPARRHWRSSRKDVARSAVRPRADMPGFRLVSETEIRQQAKYDALHSAEAKSRAAIVRGEKHFEN